jgi:hypothetical protein
LRPTMSEFTAIAIARISKVPTAFRTRVTPPNHERGAPSRGAPDSLSDEVCRDLDTNGDRTEVRDQFLSQSRIGLAPILRISAM